MFPHEHFIKRCLEIAKNGLGSTRPNPSVGCVIVYNNKIISEGYTSPYGGNHAEVNAISKLKEKSVLNKATLYVTLEPCSHYGKTPPCSDLIIKHNIPNVVIGCIDDNKEVAGKGIKKLMEAGINVVVGVLEDQCKTHHKRFFTFHNKKRPYIILKWAETMDGFIAPETKKELKPVWISNTFSRQLTHKWRTEEQAILIGTNTAKTDNPTLNVRDWNGQNPTRVILDKKGLLPETLNIFNDKANTIRITEELIDFSKNVAQQICDYLFKKNINSVIIEGGSKTLQTFINENIWDEARVFIGNSTLAKGTQAPIIKGNLISKEKIQSDILKIYSND